ncbi:hypothetical protein PLEOSDRAFT_21054 [Pleurotus ostreatus PC15]|uniref:Uncharacterized protein n=1 Tax=Pleurotus ostreatus (strain PC15) TaxID=1137138 RepID=A0A067PCF8_PLEO1|nr:hypothetical protein PLEOSDRAFT_21054 [Pleurotus ostreatus PC15]
MVNKLARKSNNGTILFEPFIVDPPPLLAPTIQQIASVIIMASPELSTLARSKLHSSVSGRESWNLHRWVLLKNSYHSTCIPSTAARTADITPVNIPNLGSEDVEEADDDDDMEVGDSFMFPDAGKLGEPRSSDINSPESQWLDSVLEGLGDDDDDEDYTTIASIRVSDTDLPTPEDEELLLSPLSPASSTDELPGGHSSYFADSIPVTYPYIIPYPHFHPPLVHPYHFESTMHSPLSSIPRPYEDPLPYYDTDDVENLSVPDAIEDTSDDESDAPSTPSLGSRSSLVDPAGIPLPGENVRRPRSHPHVYIDNQDSYFYPFELEPLPFSDDHTPHQPPYSTYQEC